MSEILLYDYWRSSASYRVRIALALKGIEYDKATVDLLSAAHKAPEHLKRNPQGFVPALDIDGLTLTQSLAILEYLDETRPEKPLLPADAVGRARVRALSHAIAMDIHPICNLGVARHVVELTGGGEEARIAWMHRFIGQGLSAFETLLDHPLTGTFCHGDEPGMADCCLMPQLYNARRVQLPLDGFKRILAIEAACEDHPTFKSAHPDAVGPPTSGKRP